MKTMIRRMIFIFILFLFVGIFLFPLQTDFSDGFFCYSFSYAMSEGLIPYIDINPIVPIFYPLLGAVFLKIFGTGYHVFILFNTIIMTGLFYFLFKLYDRRAYLFLFIVVFSYFLLIQPTYNSFLLFLFFIIIYLEKKQANDYLIGIIIGLCIITKFTVGLFFLLPSLMYIKEIKKIGRRVLGLLIPISLFVLYLLINNNILEFFDLCVLGLFNFQKNNAVYKTGNTVLFIILIVVIIYKIFKDKKNIYNYYVLSTMSFVFPIIDMHHLYFFIFTFLIIFIDDIKVEKIHAFIIIVFTSVACCYLTFYYGIFNSMRLKDNEDFKYYFINRDNKKIEILRKAFLKYEDSLIIGDDYLGAFFELYYNKNATFFNVFYKGNFGFKEDEKVIQKIGEVKRKYFIIKKDDKCKVSQYFNRASDYIKDNSKYIEDIGEYEIYLFQE